MVTPETKCLLCAAHWFWPILSELIGSARESSKVNRSRAPSGKICLLLLEKHLVVPEGSFLAPEIGILFRDAGGPSLYLSEGAHSTPTNTCVDSWRMPLRTRRNRQKSALYARNVHMTRCNRSRIQCPLGTSEWLDISSQTKPTICSTLQEI